MFFPFCTNLVYVDILFFQKTGHLAMNVHYSAYYLARVERSRVWFFVAILRSFENLAFDRTLDKAKSEMEIFVAPDRQPEFLELMQGFRIMGVLLDLQAQPNRLKA